MFDPRKLLADYKRGLGFREGDVVRFKANARGGFGQKVKGNVWVVKDQSVLAPSQYFLLGEAEHFDDPRSRFVQIEACGHDLEKA